jgi:hypothetical protein
MVIYARFISLHCETNVDQQVTTATGNEERRSRRKQDSDLRAGGWAEGKKINKFSSFFGGVLYWDGMGTRTIMRQMSEPRTDILYYCCCCCFGVSVCFGVR